MRTLIAYATKYGATEKAAYKLADNLDGEVKLVNLGTEEVVKVEAYETIVIGGSIYAGRIQSEVKEFCEANLELLKTKKVGLFICCGWSDKFKDQLIDAFPAQLLEQAVAKGYFGYEYDFEKMNFFFRLIVKTLAGVKESQSALQEEEIKWFASELLTVVN